jgi:hypothetical protein
MSEGVVKVVIIHVDSLVSRLLSCGGLREKCIWKAIRILGIRIRELALSQAANADSSLCCRKPMDRFQLATVDLIHRLPTTRNVSQSRKTI